MVWASPNDKDMNGHIPRIGLHTLAHAEANGLGNRKYKFVIIN
jgi:hypothetical protein